MTVELEWKELRLRFWSMIDAIFLLILSALHLAVSAVFILCVVFTTTFTEGRRIIDRQAARIAAPKEAT